MSTLGGLPERSPGGPPALPDDTVDLAIEVIAEELAPATRLAYSAAWAGWEAWCADHQRQALPAAPADLVGWLTTVAFDDREPRLAPGTCAQRLCAVAHRHRTTLDGATGEALGDPTAHPAVRQWLRGYRRRVTSLGGGMPRQATPLTAEGAAAIRATATAPRTGPGGRTESPDAALHRGLADRVIVGLLRDGLLRRGEAAALRWGDLADDDAGAGVITVRRSKTDTDGAGAVLWISPPTMRDIAAWRERLSFFGADVGPEAPLVGLSAPSIARRLAAAGEAAGLPDRLSGHSGRVGMAQDLVGHGLDLAATMQAGRWSTPNEVARYARRLAAKRGAVARYYAERAEA